MLRINQPLYSPDESSAGASSSEPTVEQLQQQLKETEKKYNVLQAKVTDGKLVDPEKLIESKVSAGELFPADRYKGLQTKFQETQTKLQELETNAEKWQGDLSKLEETVKTKETLLSEKEGKLTELEKSQKRAMLIFTKFPELASFEADGLLPVASDEKLEETLAAFSGKISSLKETAGKEFAAGGASPSPKSAKDQMPPTGKQTANAYLKLANEAMGKGDFGEYNKQYDLYIDALAKQSV